MLAEASAFEMASRHFHPPPGESLHIAIGVSISTTCSINGIKSDIAMYGVKHTQSIPKDLSLNTIA